MIINFVGYAPDVDPSQPGVVTDVTNMIPTAKGLRVIPSPVNAGYSSFGSEVRGLVATRQLSGNALIFAGTATKLYSLSSGASNDVSRVGDYALGADIRWSFAQFGDSTIAAADEITLQKSDAGGDFADISGAPKAAYVATAGGFVMVANTNDATFGDQADRWWCSAFQDATDWSPSIQTQSASGRLIDSPGPIRGLKSLGDYFVAYKDRAIFIATYVGGDTIWQWTQVPGDYGVTGNGSIVTTNNSHFFLGENDFYMFDGTRAVPIGSPVRETFFQRVSHEFLYKTIGAYDRINGVVWWFYVSTDSVNGVMDEAICYNIRYNKWGKARFDIECAAEYISGSITYDGLGTRYTTWDDLPTMISYDSPFWVAETPVLAFVDTSHDLQILSGIPESGSLTTGNFGDDWTMITCTGVKPRFTVQPTSSTLENLIDYESGESFTPVTTTTMIDGRYDFLQSSRWHRFVLSFTGDAEIIGIAPNFVSSGTR